MKKAKPAIGKWVDNKRNAFEILIESFEKTLTNVFESDFKSAKLERSYKETSENLVLLKYDFEKYLKEIANAEDEEQILSSVDIINDSFQKI